MSILINPAVYCYVGSCVLFVGIAVMLWRAYKVKEKLEHDLIVCRGEREALLIKKNVLEENIADLERSKRNFDSVLASEKRIFENRVKNMQKGMVEQKEIENSRRDLLIESILFDLNLLKTEIEKMVSKKKEKKESLEKKEEKEGLEELEKKEEEKEEKEEEKEEKGEKEKEEKEEEKEEREKVSSVFQRSF